MGAELEGVEQDDASDGDRGLPRVHVNPAVYLDTVVLRGSVANAQPGRQWWFGGGAPLGSVLWFIALGLAAGLLFPLLRRPAAWRTLVAFVAVVMTTTALRLVLTG